LNDNIISHDYLDLSKEILDDVDDDLEAENSDNDFISVNTTNTKFKVGPTLKPYTYYEFKVAAVNQLGHSQETEPIRVRTAATSIFIYIYFLDKFLLLIFYSNFNRTKSS
jgi:hypothetical protein